jgi:hypothetical protein
MTDKQDERFHLDVYELGDGLIVIEQKRQKGQPGGKVEYVATGHKLRLPLTTSPRAFRTAIEHLVRHEQTDQWD